MRVTRRDALRSSLGAAASASFPRISKSAPASTDDSQISTASTTSTGSDQLLSLNDYEDLAKQRLSHVAWEYYASGGGDEHTVRWNREALANIRLKPRVLVDLAHVDTKTRLLGAELPHPIL